MSDIPPCELHTLKSLRTGVDQGLEVVASALRELEGPKFEVGRERYEITEDELGSHRVAFESRVHNKLEAEGTVEGWRRLEA